MRNTILRFITQPKGQLITSIVLAVAAFGVFGYWALSIAEHAEQVSVIAAATDLTAPRVLTDADVQIIRIRRDLAPSNALVDREKLVGVTLTHPLTRNQIITLNEVVNNVNPDLAGLTVPSDLKGTSLPNAWLAAPLPEMKKNDTVMIIVSAPGKEGVANTGILAENVPVLSVDQNENGQVERILLGLDVPTAVHLLQARANNLLIHVIIDGLATAYDVMEAAPVVTMPPVSASGTAPSSATGTSTPAASISSPASAIPPVRSKTPAKPKQPTPPTITAPVTTPDIFIPIFNKQSEQRY
jgi:hypothetical protein